jgi:serine protease Do
MKRILIFLLIGFFLGVVYFRIFEPKKFEKKLDIIIPTESNEAQLAKFVAQTSKDHAISVDQSRRNAITNAIETVFPSVVGINVRSVAYRQGTIYDLFQGNRYRKYETSSVGSGFVISEDGFIVTNQHVIANATEITVAFPNGKKYKAEKIGADEQADIALIKIIESTEKFHAVPLGDSDDLMLGEWSIAIGNPFGLNDINSQPTVTLGIISGLDKDFGHIEGEQTVYYNMIQTDAAINSGNSGGPLVNASGEVIGMNTFIYTGGSGGRGNVGIAFAIPMNDIIKTVQQLQLGDIERDVNTGIARIYENSRELAVQYNLPVDHGVMVWSFEENAPAYNAGMRRGDIIIEINGQPIERFRDLKEAVFFSGLRVGDTIEVKAYREKKLLSFRIKLSKQR